LLARAEARRQAALDVAADVGLLGGWRRYGEPIVVGAVAHGLVVAPDVDLEVYCDEPLIADGFALLSRWAQHPRVCAASFRNALDTPDLGLYWQLRYTAADGERWKIDMWSVRHDHPGPLGRDLIAPMAAALTRQSRAAILALKEALRRDGRSEVRSIDLYRAVLEGGVGDEPQLDAWLGAHPAPALVDWKPSPPHQPERR
jgi:hypothetical protein